ncbi:unnamed protein product [Prunus armeniaca]|uniref:Uncharacterized protein n=1 Tax=Prunus armeniaca TaxID=36596 RepID=A0A6J5URD5_PRUAR|nr:unnamed protein product [Prunus armeniaca]
MGDQKISQPSAAAELTDVHGHALTSKDELLGKISEMEKSLAALSDQQIQLVHLTKSIAEQLRLLRASVTGASVNTCTPNPNDGALHPYPSLPMEIEGEHASMMVNQGEARSVYLVVSFWSKTAIYEVKFRHGRGVSHEPTTIGLVAKFNEDKFCHAARISKHSKLYCLTQHSGYIVDMNSFSRCSSIPPNLANEFIAKVVSAYGKIYCVASPTYYPSVLGTSFWRYDPDKNIWEPLPCCEDYHMGMIITGYAVCHGVILFSLVRWEKNQFDVVAFDLSRNQWNRVKVDTTIKYAHFIGRAVVVGTTIYAPYGNCVIEFSLRMQKGDDGGIAYSLRQLFILEGLEIADPPLPFERWKDDYLVHLGKRDFCHVSTGNNEGFMVQHICITTFQIVVGETGRDMIKTIHSTVHSVDMEGPQMFCLLSCFARDCEDYEPIGDESNWILQKEAKWENGEIANRPHEIGSYGRIGTFY